MRDNVIRNRQEWVPAVIRHNKIPTRMLLEVCNLGNRKDRELIKTRKYRQQLAEAIYQGIVDFYASGRRSRHRWSRRGRRPGRSALSRTARVCRIVAVSPRI